MQKRKTLLILSVLAVLCVALVAPVYAAYSNSIIYTKFNSLTWTDYSLGQSYSYMTADVKTKLTFEGTPGVSAKIAFSNDTAGDPSGIILVFGDDESTLSVYYNQGADEVLIGSGTYTNDGNATTRIVFSGGKLDIYTRYGIRGSQAQIVDGFSFNENFAYLRVKGTDTNTTTNGFAQVDVNAGASGGAGNMSNIVMGFLPVIVLFAMLGVVLGLLKKFGKI
jgi:hypothetical protein